MVQPDRLRREPQACDAVLGELGITGSYFTCSFNCCLASRQQRQFVVRSLQQRARQHAEKFRRRVHGQIEGFTGDCLLALFAAIFPARPTVLYFEMFFDRRLHVIIAMTVVFDRQAGVIEFPTRSDVIAAAAIVIGIFSAHCAVRLDLNGLCASRVPLNKYFVSALFRREAPAFGSQQLVGKQAKGNNSCADNKRGKLSFAPIGKDVARRNVRCSFQALGRHFKGPRDD